jgi:hypothetical protein
MLSLFIKLPLALGRTTGVSAIAVSLILQNKNHYCLLCAFAVFTAQHEAVNSSAKLFHALQAKTQKAYLNRSCTPFSFLL